MKSLISRSLKSLLLLSLCILLLPGMAVLLPADVQAFGSLTENGTAQFMGIGVNPTKILHVSGTGPGTVPLFQRGSDSAGFIIERTSTNRWVLGVNESPTLGNGFVLSTIPTGNTSVPRLLITQDGNVGIGTTSPTKRLQVETNGSDEAVYGKNAGSGPGVHGQSAGGAGVIGDSSGAYNGVVGNNNGNGCGVFGNNTAAGYGVKGHSDHGHALHGFSIDGQGVHGEGGTYGVYGQHDSNNYGYLGGGNYGVYGYSSTYAGYFQGKAVVTDNLSVGKTTAPNSTLQVAGSFAAAYRTIGENYTATAADHIISVNSASSVTITLPSASGIAGRLYTVKRRGIGAATIACSDGQYIDSGTTYNLAILGDFVTVVSNGFDWETVGK